VIALSTTCDELPAIHYAIARLGGPVRVVPYTRFGSELLAQGARSALEGRSAAILQNHGAITYGPTLAEAYERAGLLEWLAGVYRRALHYGSPRLLTSDELNEVVAEVRRRRYGEAAQVAGADGR
jgi:L-fuculose-phosphate aldolase